METSESREALPTAQGAVVGEGETKTLGRRAGLSVAHVYMAVALATVALITLFSQIPPYDFWMQIAFGRETASTGHIATTHPSSFMIPADTPAYHQPWLAELWMYGLYAAGGAPLVLLMQTAVLVGAYALLLGLMIRVSGGSVRACVVTFVLCVLGLTSTYWVVRPQTYVLPIFVAVLALSYAKRFRWGWPMWPIAPLLALWANLHGTFVVGLGVLGLVTGVEGARTWFGVRGALSWRECRSLATWTVLAFLATLVNPRGVGIYLFPFQIAKSLNGAQMFVEWARPLFTSVFGRMFYGIALAQLLLLVRWFHRARRFEMTADLVLGVVLFAASTTSLRYIVWFGLSGAPMVARALAETFPRLEAGVQRRAREAGVMLALIGVTVCGGWIARLHAPGGFHPFTPDTPIAAVERLRALPPAERPERLFHHEGVGSYLMWAAPEQKVFIDPCFTLYSHDQWMDLARLDNGLYVDRLISKYRFDGMLLEHERQAKLIDYLSKDSGWKRIYDDEASALFVRADLAARGAGESRPL